MGMFLTAWQTISMVLVLPVPARALTIILSEVSRTAAMMAACSAVGSGMGLLLVGELDSCVYQLLSQVCIMLSGVIGTFPDKESTDDGGQDDYEGIGSDTTNLGR